MDVERHVVRVDGEAVPLPLKEFELLELLLRNAGRVLTRGQLIDRVWGADYVGDTKTLDVHVKRLRVEDRAGAVRAALPRHRPRPRATSSSRDSAQWHSGRMPWTAPDVNRPDGSLTAGEGELFRGLLDFQRATLLHKCAGLTGEQMASTPVPLSGI